MPREIDVHFHLHLTPFTLKAGLVAGFLCASAVELGSESVTLTTYYPAPSGVYTRMITTGNTYLARDGAASAVLIGNNSSSPLAPAASAKLEIFSTTMGFLPPRMTTAERTGIGSPAVGLMVYDTTEQKLYIYTTGGWVPAGAGYWSLTGNDISNTNPGNVNIVGTARISGANASRRGYLYINNSWTGCSATTVLGGNVSDFCSSNQYSTWTPGLHIEGWSYSNRGGQPRVNAPGGVYGTQVWGMNPSTGNPEWMTLNSDDSTLGAIFCCSR